MLVWSHPTRLSNKIGIRASSNMHQEPSRLLITNKWESLAFERKSRTSWSINRLATVMKSWNNSTSRRLYSSKWQAQLLYTFYQINNLQIKFQPPWIKDGLRQKGTIRSHEHALYVKLSKVFIPKTKDYKLLLCAFTMIHHYPAICLVKEE